MDDGARTEADECIPIKLVQQRILGTSSMKNLLLRAASYDGKKNFSSESIGSIHKFITNKVTRSACLVFAGSCLSKYTVTVDRQISRNRRWLSSALPFASKRLSSSSSINA